MSTIHNLNDRAEAIGEMFGVNTDDSTDTPAVAHPIAGFVTHLLVSAGATAVAIEMAVVVTNAALAFTGWVALSYAIWVIALIAAFIGGFYVGSMAGEYIATGRFHKDVNHAVASTKNFFANKFGKKAA